MYWLMRGQNRHWMHFDAPLHRVVRRPPLRPRAGIRRRTQFKTAVSNRFDATDATTATAPEQEDSRLDNAETFATKPSIHGHHGTIV
jgi:hypothetical protein